MKRVEMRMNQELGKKLLSILKEEQVKKDEPMKSHTNVHTPEMAVKSLCLS